MMMNFIYSNEESVMNRSENVSIRGEQFVSILKKPKLINFKCIMEKLIDLTRKQNIYSILK